MSNNVKWRHCIHTGYINTNFGRGTIIRKKLAHYVDKLQADYDDDDDDSNKNNIKLLYKDITKTVYRYYKECYRYYRLYTDIIKNVYRYYKGCIQIL
jgi:hypothetical protein